MDNNEFKNDSQSEKGRTFNAGPYNPLFRLLLRRCGISLYRRLRCKCPAIFDSGIVVGKTALTEDMVKALRGLVADSPDDADSSVELETNEERAIDKEDKKKQERAAKTKK